MRKHLKFIPILLSSMLVFAGCDNYAPNWPMETPSEADMEIETEWVDYVVPCKSITLAKGQNSLNLNKGETHQFSYTLEPRDVLPSSLTWQSDNPSVATVENGLLTAVGGGSANISVSSGDAMARSRVTVSVPIQDFEISNKSLDLDFGQETQLVPVFIPSDTTQNALSYEVVTSGVVSVSETGLVTALSTEGDAEIRVTNEAMNKIETVNVHVSDKWNYISAFTLEGPTSLEVTKSTELSPNIVGIDSSVPATTLRNNVVTYEVKEGSESFVSVDENTGEVLALEPGDATIVASILEERSNMVKTAEFNVHVFEVSATAINFTETTAIELDNNENLSHQFNPVYTLDDPNYSKPSRGNIEYASSDTKVATVDANGLVSGVGPGSATITVNDKQYNVSDTITVHNTVYAKSVQLSQSGPFYLDEKIVITANVTPAKTTDNLVWDYDNTLGHTFVEEGTKLTITCNNLDEEVIIKASVGTTESNVLTLAPIERELDFEQNKTYIVGSSNYKTGVSKDCGAEGSWQKAKYAFIMTDKTGNAHAKYEYKAVIEFRENDLWKIRENVSDWREIEGYAGPEESQYKTGYYKITEGAFAKGQMAVSAGNEVLVKSAGKYDVYYAFYENEHPEGWYEVYVEEHGLKLSSTDVHAKITTPEPTVSKIVASNYEGTLSTSEVDTNFINVEVNSTTGVILITPVAIGETTFKVCDSTKEIVVNVDIKAGSSAVATDLYIRGTAANGWGEVSNEYVLRQSEDANNVGEILDVYLSQGDFKIANADWSVEYGWDYDGHSTIIGGAAAKFSASDDSNNIKCNVSGFYNIYLTTNHYISIETVGGDEPSNLSPYYIRGTAVSPDVNWPALPAYQMSVGEDENIAQIIDVSLSVGEFKIADATWSKIWGYKYKNNGEAEDHITIKGAAAANFEEGASDGNIKCKVAGVYDIYLTNDNYISVNVHADPGVSYTVSFNNNGGSGSMADVPDQSGSYTLPANGFTAPEGYEFAGWKANNAGDTLAAGASHALSADVVFYAQWQLPYVANNVTLYLTANWSGWESPKAYVYDTSNSDTPKVAWPGEAMTYVGVNDDNDTIFSYTVDINTYDKIIFHNGSGGDNNQTVDFDISTAVNADAYYLSGHVGGDDANKIEITKWGTYTSDALTSKDIVYFTNNKGWSDPNFYVFNSSTSTELTAWPGNAAKWVGENEYHQGIYRLVIDTSAYDSFIFNGGGVQTVDILVSSLTGDNNAFYATDTQDGKGHYEVDQWKYNLLA